MDGKLEAHEDLELRLLFWNEHNEAVCMQMAEERKSEATRPK